MTVSFLALAIGLVGLVWSADRFVHGAASLAHNFGVSTFVIGLTIVALGTSAPEILVSVMASLDNAPGLAIGNAIGSNIANIGLVLGVTALIANLHVQKEIINKDLSIALLISLIVVALLYDQELTQIDGVLLLTTLGLYLIYLFRYKAGKTTHGIKSEDVLAMDYELAKESLGKDINRAQSIIEIEEELEEEFAEPTLTAKQAIFSFISGLAILLLSSKILVWGSGNIAHHFGISDTLIGLTMVAVGTSLPELAASISSALKGHQDIAIANVIGSNIYNMLTVLPVPALMAPSHLEPGIWTRDLPVMVGLGVLLLLMLFVGKKQTLTWPKGVILLCLYVGYYVVLFQQGIDFSTHQA